MPAHAAHPLAPDAVVALARELPPHRGFEAFLDRLAALRRAPVLPSRGEAFLASVGPDVTVAALAHAEAVASRTFHSTPASYIAEVAAALRARWPTPAAGELRLIERLDALHELARLREAGELSASAAVRLAFVLDPARAAEPPADLAAWFGQGPGPVGLRAARACLVATAPTFWRLAGAEFDRLVDRLDPAAP
ncbi:MAG: hypothetical protein Q7U06_01955 [Pseudomonadota bacterium]|nr:hypothetical protein [Pseudomonadota bacterium]